MELRAVKGAQFHIALAFALLLPSAAHAQRIPEVAIWSAGAGLFAPFVAVPFKLGFLHFTALKTGASRLWQISAIEWLILFPVAFIALRSGRSSSAPLTVLVLFGLVVWLHRERIPGARWRSALLLSLIAPILTIGLPVLTLAVIAYLESLAR